MKQLLQKLLMKSFSFFGAANHIRNENTINYNPLMTKHIVDSNTLENEPFFLIDVGASGGIHNQWEAFGEYLHGVGFDPLVKECGRLNGIKKNKNVQYVPSYIIADNPEIDNLNALNSHIGFDDRITLFPRTSACRMMKILHCNYEQEVFNSGQEIEVSNNQISLDRYCEENRIKAVDFIKTDTDGFDFHVLKGADKILDDEKTLGAFVEFDFNAPLHPYSNSFRNIDRFLTEKGFSLFDISAWRYTRKDLPGKFVYDNIPAQTQSGQVSWGDALFLRDFILMKKAGKTIPTHQIIKMACIQEILGFSDCAAELLVAFQEQLSSKINTGHCLDLLAKNMNLYSSYQEHMLQFNTNPKKFYPG